MPDTLDTALFIIAVIAVWSIGLLLIKGKFDYLISVVAIAVIFFALLAFYDREESAKINDDKLSETKDKWQHSEVMDR